MKRILGFAALIFLLFYGVTHKINLPFQSKTQKSVEKTVEAKQENKSDPKEEARWIAETLTLRRLKAAMNDPKSFDLVEALRMSGGSLCLTYRARNRFNALILSRAVITTKRSMVSEEIGFADFWNKVCGGKVGDNITSIKVNL